MKSGEYPFVNILIPTFNSSDGLDATMDSIASLEYPKEKLAVLFADFGSTDDTIDKVFKFRRHNTGVYALSGRRIGRTMIGDTAGLLTWTARGNTQVALFPGDVLYPKSLETALVWLKKVEMSDAPCGAFVSEVDIRRSDGSISGMRPLFSKPCFIKKDSADLGEYMRHGYCHQVFCYGSSYRTSSSKTYVQVNMRSWWNEIVYSGLHQNILYFNKPLGCFRERFYDDELDQMAFRMECLCTLLRMNREYPDRCVFGDDFEGNARFQLSRYSLWRAWLLHGQGKQKDAEDCFLFSRVINPQIEREELFMRTQQFFASDDVASRDWLAKYYATDEATLKPKRPLWSNAFLGNLWWRIRQLAWSES